MEDKIEIKFEVPDRDIAIDEFKRFEELMHSIESLLSPEVLANFKSDRAALIMNEKNNVCIGNDYYFFRKDGKYEVEVLTDKATELKELLVNTGYILIS